jgi:hypothetical protein
MMPLAASNPATTNDLCFHDTTNAATDNAMALITMAAASPADCNSAGPPNTLVKTKASVAAAKPTEIASFEFVIIWHNLWLDLFYPLLTHDT